MYIRRILVVIAVLGLLVLGYISYGIYRAIFEPNTKFVNSEAVVLIKSTDGIKEVEDLLVPLLNDTKSFLTIAAKKGYRVKGGKYILTKGMNNNEIVNTLRSRNTPVKLSFNNQERLENLAGRIAMQIEADSIELLRVFKEERFLQQNNFTTENGIAMYVPNSYEIYWNTTAIAFRDRMLKEYKRFWNEDRKEKAKLLGLKPSEVVSLAAIVHKETVQIKERPRVAGLYLNRLKKGMFLQADPTVIYAIKKHTGDFNRVIKRVLNKDLEIDSKYNTYKYTGVPPGPITMPDISAIDAVLNPENHSYLYMVADVQNSGYHKFAKTLAQHNKNAREYHQWINKMQIMR